MGSAHSFASTLLRTSAGSYAGITAATLLERDPGLEQRFGPDALATWKAHLQRRVVDLATAVAFEAPQLFAERVDWERLAFDARGHVRADLELAMCCLRDVLASELPPNAWESVGSSLDLALARFAHEAPQPTRALDPQHPHERLALRYLSTALDGDTAAAVDALVAACADGLSIEDAYVAVLMMAQREIGRMWHMGEVTVCEEHLVTATTRRAIGVLMQRAARQPAVGKTVLAASVTGNAHDMGLQAVSDFLELAGYRSILVGADCPAEDLAISCRAFDADLLVLSATLTRSLPDAARTVEACRKSGNEKLRILVGGQAFLGELELWKRTKADGFATTAVEAIALADRLSGVVRT